MALLRVFRTPKHQRFEYKPRHWDPKKEELQKRLDQIEKMKQKDPNALKARIAQNFRRGGLGNAQARRQAVLRSNLLLLGIIVVLLMMAYIFISVYLTQLDEALGTQG